MDNILGSNSVKFEAGWYRGINFDNEATAFLKIINQATKENDVQRYIKDKEKWFIPASLFEDCSFGHNDTYIVPEQALGAEFRSDYMLLGYNSAGYHIVLVEFEDVNVDYKIQSSNAETSSVRKGLVQIRDWKRWMDSNREYFMKSCGLADIGRNIPTWGINYFLVVSRRSRMNDIANEMRRQSEHETQGLHIVTYDRLVDNIKRLSNGF